MKTPIRYQSRLLIRRSYKPARIARRRLGITFRPSRPAAVLISRNQNDKQHAIAVPREIRLSDYSILHWMV